MFENPRRSTQARNFTINVPKIPPILQGFSACRGNELELLFLVKGRGSGGNRACYPEGGVLPYIYAVLIWKRVYTLLILDWNRVGFSREERASMNIFIVSIPNEEERKRNTGNTNSKWLWKRAMALDLNNFCVCALI